MRNILKYYFLIVLMFLPIEVLYPQWVQTNGTNTGVVNGFAIHTIAGDSILFAGASTGIFRTSNNGNSWDSVNIGLTNGSTQALKSIDTNLFALTGGGLFRFNNYLQSWDSVNTGLTSNNASILTSKDSMIYVGTSGGVFYSNNSGETWSISSSSPNDIKAIVSMNNNIFASQGLVRDAPGIFVSTNNGASWSGIRGGEGGRTGQYYTSLAVLDTFLIAGSVNSNNYGVVILYYNGERWTVYNAGLYPRTHVYSVLAYEKRIFAVTDSGLFYSKNIGADWENIGLRDYHISSIILFSNSIFALADSSIYYSGNYGANWLNIGLTEESISSCIIYHGYIFAGTTSGKVWKRLLTDVITSADKNKNNIPTNYKLEQNYPNPFNPITKIRYSVPMKSYISLKIYNQFGKEIATLFKGVRQPGNYEETFICNGFASGVYFYRLKANNFEQTKKLLLIK